MRFRFTKEEEQFRKEVREFLAQEREKHQEELALAPTRGSFPYQYWADLGKTGWLGVSYPVEYGGQGRPPIYMAILTEELLVRAPEPISTAQLLVNTSAPAILDHGSEELKKRFLPPIISGEIRLAGGFTEPDAGSDVSNIATRAVKDGKEYVINGHKLYNDAYLYDWIMLSARTDPNVPKNKGITIFMIDLKSPGISINPLWTMWGFRRNEVVLEDVRVPEENIIGELNKAWDYIVTSERNNEWLIFSNTAAMGRSFEGLASFVKQAKRDGKPLSESPTIRHMLAEMALELEILRLLYYRSFWAKEKGLPLTTIVSMAKIYYSELNYRFYNAMIDILGQAGQLVRTKATRELTPIGGIAPIFYQFAPSQAIAGWTPEVARNRIVAELGLPTS